MAIPGPKELTRPGVHLPYLTKARPSLILTETPVHPLLSLHLTHRGQLILSAPAPPATLAGAGPGMRLLLLLPLLGSRSPCAQLARWLGG